MGCEFYFGGCRTIRLDTLEIEKRFELLLIRLEIVQQPSLTSYFNNELPRLTNMVHGLTGCILITSLMIYIFALELVSSFIGSYVSLSVTCPMDHMLAIEFFLLYGCSWSLLLYGHPDPRLGCPKGLSPFYLSSTSHTNPSTFSDTKEYHELVLEAKRLLSGLLPGTGVSEQLLLAPRKYQRLLEDARDEFRKHLLRLGYDDDKIDSFCDGLNQILTETQKLLALMWVLEALLNLVALVITACFSEFPNNIRPPCTTMPWNIVPALFVLWGVCWMFINQASFSLEDIDAETLQNAILSVEHDSIPTENLDDTNWEYFDNFRDVSPSGEISFNHQSQFSLVDVPLPSEVPIPAHQTSFPWKEPSNLANAISFESPWQSASNETGFLARNGEPDVLASTSSGFTTCISELRGNTQAILMPPSKDLLPPILRNSTVLSGFSEGENITIDEASQKITSATRIESRLNITEKREFRCGHVGCEDLTFSYESQLKRHLDRHSRPFTCVECSESFGAKKDLQRHLDTKHQKEVQVFCTVLGCKRGQLGFSRRDNLLKHINNVHERRDQAKGLSKLVSPNEDAAKETKSTKKRKRDSHDLEELSREELIESLLAERSKNERLLEELKQQRGKFEEDLRVQRDRYEKNEDRLWRMIEEKRQ